MYYIFNNWRYCGKYSTKGEAIDWGFEIANSRDHSTYIVSDDRELTVCGLDGDIVTVDDEGSVSHLINLLLAYGERRQHIPDYRIFLLQLG